MTKMAESHGTKIQIIEDVTCGNFGVSKLPNKGFHFGRHIDLPNLSPTRPRMIGGRIVIQEGVKRETIET